MSFHLKGGRQCLRGRLALDRCKQVERVLRGPGGEEKREATRDSAHQEDDVEDEAHEENDGEDDTEKDHVNLHVVHAAGPDWVQELGGTF